MNRRQFLQSLVTVAAVALTPIVAKADSIKHGKKYPFIQNKRTKRAIRNGQKQRAIYLQIDQISRYQAYLAK